MDTYLDVDGCVLDTTYEPTTKLIVPKDVRITLNSNRGLDSLLRVQQQVGIDGPVIFENGGGSYENGRVTDYADPLERAAIEAILGRVAWIDTDTLRSPRPIDGRSMFGERTRRYTGTFYPRDGTSTNYTSAMLEETAGLLEERLEGYEVTIDPTFGNVAVAPLKTNKGTPMDDADAAFGDGVQDLAMFARARLVGCPSNAVARVRSEVERRGGLVGGPYTEGVNGFLTYLVARG